MADIIYSIITSFKVTDALDIIIVTYLIYKVLSFIRETRAQQLLRGIIILVAIFMVADLFNFYLLNWIFGNVLTMGLFAIVVIFQPELRRGLEQMGRRNLVGRQFKPIDKDNALGIVNEFVMAIDDFSATRTGALIAIERDTMLNDISETGAIIDADINARLLGTIFYEGAPLHDGGVIIRGDRIHAASCVFPLTENKNIGRNLGTRHRAGVGLSEVSDALIIIVSEETGVISVAENGVLRRFMDLKSIEKLLLGIYIPQNDKFKDRLSRTLNTIFNGGVRDDR